MNMGIEHWISQRDVFFEDGRHLASVSFTYFILQTTTPTMAPFLLPVHKFPTCSTGKIITFVSILSHLFWISYYLVQEEVEWWLIALNPSFFTRQKNYSHENSKWYSPKYRGSKFFGNTLPLSEIKSDERRFGQLFQLLIIKRIPEINKIYSKNFLQHVGIFHLEWWLVHKMF